MSRFKAIQTSSILQKNTHTHTQQLAVRSNYQRHDNQTEPKAKRLSIQKNVVFVLLRLLEASGFNQTLYECTGEEWSEVASRLTHRHTDQPVSRRGDAPRQLCWQLQELRHNTDTDRAPHQRMEEDRGSTCTPSMINMLF